MLNLFIVFTFVAVWHDLGKIVFIIDFFKSYIFWK